MPEFIAYARASYPGVPFRVGSVDALDTATGSVGRVLSWCSLIHHDPGTTGDPLREFARVLSPDGELVLGFFEGSTIGRFEHAVFAAYQWSVGDLSDKLRAAGFDVIETHTRTGRGYRPYGAVVAGGISVRC